MRTLNLGILAHVDAGKTSLTERLLYDVGVIDAVGSVDRGSTQTDSSVLERRRGITITSAVVSFVVGDVVVNLVDTPGHPDFIAEVERVLSVLDAAVLVVSAVEGVQAQTRILFRALRRLRIPTVVLVNKIDRRGADPDGVLAQIRERLDPSVLALGGAADAGSPAARALTPDEGDTDFAGRLLELLAERDEELLAAWVEGRRPPYAELRRRLAAQTRRGQLLPVLFGSAITGAGVPELLAALVELLPAVPSAADAPLSGRVFKVDRGTAGEKRAYLRLFGGTVRVRDRLRVGSAPEARVTALGVFDRGGVVPQPSVAAGRIALVTGLGQVRIGDAVGLVDEVTPPSGIAPPTLETVVAPVEESRRGALRTALEQLAEQDPLIDVRSDDTRREISLSLYGEVQKEVIEATLAEEYGIAVTFRETTTICTESPAGSGEALESIGVDGNPFLATVGLRVDPAVEGSGVSFGYAIELGSLPLAFLRAVEEAVHGAAAQGLHGWPLTDCAVTLTRSHYWPRQSHAHATFDKSMSSTAGDFRHLTPLVLMAALRRAGTRVHEPLHRYRLEVPEDCLAAVLTILARRRAVWGPPDLRGRSYRIEGEVPAAEVHTLQQQLPGLTRGEGVLESAFEGYRPVVGVPPERPRTDANPLDRRQYLLRVDRRGFSGDS